MRDPKLTNWLLAVLTALLLSLGGFLYTRVIADGERISAVSERIARVESQSLEVQRRLEKIEEKLDRLLEVVTK